MGLDGDEVKPMRGRVGMIEVKRLQGLVGVG